MHMKMATKSYIKCYESRACSFYVDASVYTSRTTLLPAGTVHTHFENKIPGTIIKLQYNSMISFQRLIKILLYLIFTKYVSLAFSMANGKGKKIQGTPLATC